MSSTEIVSTAVPTAIAEARAAMIRMLRAAPEDLVSDLCVVEALAILEDVYPPYPPPPPDDVAWTLDEGVRVARDALRRAIDESRSAAEAVRCAHASRTLAGADLAGFP